MCMGYGCNAVGVIGARIITSPRERLLAILTNVFAPCNGRFPLLITLSAVFFAGNNPSAASVIGVMSIVILGLLLTFLTNLFLSKTLLKGEGSFFAMELPPYRKPQIFTTLLHSFIERTIKVLWRAIIVSIPAGVILWIMANTFVADSSLLTHSASFLEPFARLMGLDGFILLAFFLALPANEIVLPIIIMSYLSSSTMTEIHDLSQLRSLLTDNGWSALTAINVMLFSLMHYPCGTTLLTIHKETKSIKWVVVAFAVPTVLGILVTFATAGLWRLLVI